MRPFNPFSLKVTADEIRNFMRFEFPYVPEAESGATKKELQKLAQKWIKFHEQAESSKHGQRSSKEPIDTKPVLKTKCTNTDNVPMQSSSKQGIQKPSRSQPTTSAGVPASPPPSTAPKGTLLKNEPNVGKGLSERRSLSNENIKHSKQSQVQPPLASSTTSHKKKPAARKLSTRKSEPIVAAQSLDPSPKNTSVPKCSVKTESAPSPSSSASSCKRDMDEAFGDTHKNTPDALYDNEDTAEAFKKENASSSNKRPKAVLAQARSPIQKKSRATTSATKDPIVQKPKQRRQIDFSDSSSLTSLDTLEGSSAPEQDPKKQTLKAENVSISKAKKTPVAAKSNPAATTAPKTTANNAESSKQKNSVGV
ncbi:uncharacterized protein MELLADRAFT_63981 [Melampsora larici-populina 98AG31]|uniref:Uncharacterized protein n=1 Tax=Melampsora larici-populina (strain 98AG31 / pathotype 3-4-7) TaxID=747676 RepID=F4RPQ2_MELLP|nr:uncharacterized protein MELLADRAFT_63981 [Melampsora larici-populina 98AG31]EGG05580.1 hypothetical protein MELLADRAFT_63981 [Melampsora larici-populina 98AG31]